MRAAIRNLPDEMSASPWRYATSAYEREKYDVMLAALPASRIGAVLEIGCAIGVLTEHLATRSDSALAVDMAENAPVQARARCTSCGNVTIARMRISTDWPEGRFDLILLSEILYYLSADDRADRAARANRALPPSATPCWCTMSYQPIIPRPALRLRQFYRRHRIDAYSAAAASRVPT